MHIFAFNYFLLWIAVNWICWKLLSSIGNIYDSDNAYNNKENGIPKKRKKRIAYEKNNLNSIVFQSMAKVRQRKKNDGKRGLIINIVFGIMPQTIHFFIFFIFFSVFHSLHCIEYMQTTKFFMYSMQIENISDNNCIFVQTILLHCCLNSFI